MAAPYGRYAVGIRGARLLHTETDAASQGKIKKPGKRRRIHQDPQRKKQRVL